MQNDEDDIKREIAQFLDGNMESISVLLLEAASNLRPDEYGVRGLILRGLTCNHRFSRLRIFELEKEPMSQKTDDESWEHCNRRMEEQMHGLDEWEPQIITLEQEIVRSPFHLETFHSPNFLIDVVHRTQNIDFVCNCKYAIS